MSRRGRQPLGVVVSFFRLLKSFHLLSLRKQFTERIIHYLQVGENGEKGLALSGIVTISDNKEFTGFQSLDAVLPDIRESLAGGKSVRVIDLIQTIPWRR